MPRQEDRVERRIRKYEKKLQKYKKRRERSTNRRGRSTSSSRGRSRSRSRSPLQSETLRRSRSRRHNLISPEPNYRGQSERPKNTPDSETNIDYDIIEESLVQDDENVPPHLAEALGEELPMEEKYGAEIKNILTSRWLPALQKGIDDKQIQETLKKYKIPNNCKLLEAPQLNLEVKVALTEVAKNRDRQLQEKQQQLGMALTAIGHAMSYLLDQSEDIPKILNHLSDGSKLLTSLHNNYTKMRKHLVSPLLDKNFLKLAESTTRDEFLFGENLSEKIKNNTLIYKSGLQIKKPLPQRPSTSHNLGNWTGPPRHRKTTTTTQRGGLKRSTHLSSQGKPPNMDTNPRRQPPQRPTRPSQRARPRR